METLEFLVEAGNAGQRLDRFLAERELGLTRNALQQLIEEGYALCNGQPAAKSRKLKERDRLLLTVPDAKPATAVAQDIPLDVVYEDEHLLVVNKPKGMVVHPAPGNPDGTLVNALLYHCKGSLSGIGGELRPGIVHRIDKDTSGLLVVAKDDPTHTALSAQMAVHSIHRLYQAVVYGGFRQDEGFVEAPIGRSTEENGDYAHQFQIRIHGLAGAGPLSGLYAHPVQAENRPHPSNSSTHGQHWSPTGRGWSVWPAQCDQKPERPVPARKDTWLCSPGDGGVSGI